MISPRDFLRVARITQVFVKHGLDDFVIAIHLFRPYRYLLHLMPWRWRARVRQPRGQRLREALEELGPIFVKFGQMLSTRPDLLPEDIATELSRLQDRVPPFPAAQARAVIERAYGAPLEEHFKTFEAEPVASASVAQVHLATLADGSEVAVKVLRPGIHKVIHRDVELLYTLADLASRYLPDGRRLRPVEVVDEFSKNLEDELDLMREAANASQLRNNFKHSELLYVPRVYWEHTRHQVMVMARIDGTPVSNIAHLKAAGIDLRTLAHHGVEIFFTQAFRDGYFHADMHPGNIFVGGDGRYQAVDFGIMGSLSDADKNYLAENFLAFFNRDYRAVAEAHLRAGWVPAETRVDEFEAAIRTVCEPIFAKPLSEISFGRLLVRLFQTARRFDMEVQPQLVLLQKTLLNIEGLGRQLYPQLDLWETAKPFLERWMRERLGPKAFVTTLRRQGPYWWRIAPEMPGLIHEFLRKANSDELSARWRSKDLERLRREMSSNQRRLFFGVVGAALVVAAAVTAALGGFPPNIMYGAPVSTWLLGILGAVILLAAWPRER